MPLQFREHEITDIPYNKVMSVVDFISGTSRVRTPQNFTGKLLELISRSTTDPAGSRFTETS